MQNMYRIFGAVGCSSCLTCKKLFDMKGIKYSYVELDSLADSEKEAIVESAREKGISSLPIVIDCNTLEIVEWQGVIRCLG